MPLVGKKIPHVRQQADLAQLVADLFWSGIIESVCHFGDQQLGAETARPAELFAEGSGTERMADERGGSVGEGWRVLVRMIQCQTQHGVAEIARRSLLMAFQRTPDFVQQAGPPI